jgi:acyl-CoA reductase-like NAD-dependent aldehyde dehydrogenase
MSDLTLAQWQHKAAHLTLPSQAFIDGTYRDAVNGATFDCINPANGQLLTMVASCDAADAELAVQAAARAAFDDKRWAAAAQAARDHAALRRTDAAQQGGAGTAGVAGYGQPSATPWGMTPPPPLTASPGTPKPSTRFTIRSPRSRSPPALVTREPLGVVAAIVPWNFP